MNFLSKFLTQQGVDDVYKKKNISLVIIDIKSVQLSCMHVHDHGFATKGLLMKTFSRMRYVQTN